MSKVKNGHGPKEGSYQLKKKRGLVPLAFSETCRTFVACAKVGAKGNLEEARQDHNRFLFKTFGPAPAPERPASRPWSEDRS